MNSALPKKSLSQEFGKENAIGQMEKLKPTAPNKRYFNRDKRLRKWKKT